MASAPNTAAGLAPNNEAQDNTIQGLPSPTESDGWPSSASSTKPLSDSQPPALAAQILTLTEAVAKGRKLFNLMLTPSTTFSQFTNSSELKAWGYTTTIRTIMPFHHTYYTLLHLLVPKGAVEAKEVTSIHTSLKEIVDNTPIPATSAHFTNVIELSHGILIAGSNFGPAYTLQAQALKDSEAHPDLQHWSDIAYLQALYLSIPSNRVRSGSSHPAPGAIKNLKYIVRHDIENPSTNAIVHALIQHYITSPCSYNVFDTGCPYCSQHIIWPGLTLEIDTEEGLALLGTPNGRGVVWLLKQHKELTGKRVGKVSVWCDVEKKPLKPSLLFHVEGVDGEGGEDTRELIEEATGSRVREDEG